MYYSEIDMKISEILEEITGCQETEDNLLLAEDLGIDSLGMVMLLVELEDTFGIELNESDMNPNELKTVGDINELVCKYLDK